LRPSYGYCHRWRGKINRDIRQGKRDALFASRRCGRSETMSAADSSHQMDLRSAAAEHLDYTDRASGGGQRAILAGELH
jgi:hypothetical protein